MRCGWTLRSSQRAIGAGRCEPRPACEHRDRARRRRAGRPARRLRARARSGPRRGRSSASVRRCAPPSTSCSQDVRELGLDRVDELLPLGLDQDLDPRLVAVVAPAVAVVDADDRLDEDEDLLPRQELADHGADDRRAAHAAADPHLEADLAGVVLPQHQADVVPGGGGAVLERAADRDLELARQEGELGMQRAPLAQDLAVGPRVDDLVGGDAGEAVAGDVADAVAAGLDAVHVDVGEDVHHVGGVGAGRSSCTGSSAAS